MSYKIRREELPHKHTKFAIGWEGGNGSFSESIVVTRSGDRCVSIQKCLLYPGEQVVLLKKIIDTLIEEEKAYKKEEKKKFEEWAEGEEVRKIDANACKEDHIFLSPKQAKAFLKTAELRLGKAWYGKVLEVKYEGKWYSMGRIDLYNQVGTGSMWDVEKRNVDDELKMWINKIMYGARILNESFFVIDSLTDG